MVSCSPTHLWLGDRRMSNDVFLVFPIDPKLFKNITYIIIHQFQYIVGWINHDTFAWSATKQNPTSVEHAQNSDNKFEFLKLKTIELSGKLYEYCRTDHRYLVQNWIKSR